MPNLYYYRHPAWHKAAERQSHDCIWRQLYGDIVYLLPPGGGRDCAGRGHPTAGGSRFVGREYTPHRSGVSYLQEAYTKVSALMSAIILTFNEKELVYSLTPCDTYFTFTNK